MKNILRSANPLKILEQASRKSLGPGAMGVLIARAGVGKTACLINIALHHLMENRKVAHVSLGEGPEKINAYYQVLLKDLMAVCNLEDEDAPKLVEGNRVIFAYLDRSFEPARLKVQIDNLKEATGFTPDVIMVDGIDFAAAAARGLFEEFSSLAAELKAEIWFSALSHRHLSEINERGIPYPCHNLDDLFSVIIHLQPEPSGLYLRLLKDHERETVTNVNVRLDPTTFMISDPGAEA